MYKYNYLPHLHFSEITLNTIKDLRDTKNCQNCKLKGVWTKIWSSKSVLNLSRQSPKIYAETNLWNWVKYEFHRKLNSWFCLIFWHYCQIFMTGHLAISAFSFKNFLKFHNYLRWYVSNYLARHEANCSLILMIQLCFTWSDPKLW